MSTRDELLNAFGPMHRQLVMLAQIGELAGSPKNPELSFPEVCAILGRCLAAERVVFWWKGFGSNWGGFCWPADIRGVPAEPSILITKLVLRDLRTEIYPDLELPAGLDAFVQSVWQETRAYLCLPICASNQTVGMILLLSSQPREQEWAKDAAVLSHAADHIINLASKWKLAEETRLRLERFVRFTEDLTHDLGNILTPITLASNSLNSSLLKKTSQEALTSIRSSVERATQLVQQLKAFSQASRTADISPKELVDTTANVIKPTLPSSIQLSRNLPQSIWQIAGDARQLHRVMENLANNARDFMPAGGLLTLSAENFFLDEQSAKTRVGAKSGSYILLRVKDTGTGMPFDIQNRVFDRGFTTRPGKGTGLGLSTVKEIVESHQGFIDVESELGHGTEFKVYLPAHVTASDKPTTAPGRITRHQGDGELILLVDDEKMILTLTATILESSGYRVLLASQGQEALELYQEHGSQVTLVLTDNQLPDRSGPDTIRVIRQQNPEVNVILASGMDVGPEELTGIAGKAPAFLPKPYTPNELLAKLREVLHPNGRDQHRTERRGAGPSRGLPLGREAHENVQRAKAELLQRFSEPTGRVADARESTRPDGIVRSLLSRLPADSNILGVGYGSRITNGSSVKDQVALRVYVRLKKPAYRLDPAEIVPPIVNGVLTDVIEVGAIHATARTDCGVSASHRRVWAGTLGCVVRQNGNTATQFILSCNHVLADTNSGQEGDPILEPSPADGGRSDNPIARLSRWVPLDFAGDVNLMDAAIAEIENAEDVNPAIVEIGRVTLPAMQAGLGLTVMKHGRTTRYSEGVVRDVDADIRVDYDLPGGGVRTACFEHQIAIEGINGSFSLGGDSGSLILDKNNRQPVALLFAGNLPTTGMGGISFGNPIGEVLARLNLSIV